MVNTFTYDRYRNRIGQGVRVMDAETGVTGKITAFRVKSSPRKKFAAKVAYNWKGRRACLNLSL
ncbi:putative selenium delivery protein YdfZ [Rahnella aceris]